MSFADDLQQLLENCLTAYDPTVDLSTGSPAQVKIIQPVLSRFAEDPLDTDIQTFLMDRLTQEYPDLVADNGGAFSDLFAKPLQLVLEPFKREIQSVKNNQSINNATIMGDDEADALGANWFEPRIEGQYAGGPVRIFFNAPITVRVTTDKRVYTNSGLNFYPVQNYQISAAQMLFNRSGSQYYLDITVDAEAPGDQYNVSKGDIAGIDGVSGVVKVTNLADFTDGLPREDNATYLGRIPDALTERSLVTKRGILSRTPSVFQSIRALQVVGAGDDGMNRDVLQGTSEGFFHLGGTATVYGDWVLVNSIVYQDNGSTGALTVQAGDTLRFVKSGGTTSYTATVVSTQVVSNVVKLIQVDTALFAAGSTTIGSFAVLKPGYLTISGIPGGISQPIQVPDGTVHLGGHTDVLVRATEDSQQTGVLSNVTDQSPIVALLDIAIPASSDNQVTSATGNFITNGVLVGDLLVIETGTGFTGTYRILEVSNSTTLRVDTLFTGTATGLRGRIVRSITVDLVSPKIPKLPFNTGSVSDLTTVVGSNIFSFTLNIQNYGAAVGDTINVLDGLDAGLFTITGFTSQGQAIVNRPAGASGGNLRYEIYTALTGLDLPLVRLRTLEVLDSTGQGTGTTVPYGDAVEIVPTCDLDGADDGESTFENALVIFPDMSGIWGDPVTGPTLASNPVNPASINSAVDARYTQKLAESDGVIQQTTGAAGNPITTTEINLPPFLWNGRRDKVLALPTRKDPNYPTGTGLTNQTSDLAEANIGDTFTILAGPNQGSYIIKDKRILDLWGNPSLGHQKVALIQVDPEFPVDPLRSIIDLCDGNGGTLTATQLVSFFQAACGWDDAGSFYNNTFIPNFRTVLTGLGITISSQDTTTLVDSLCRTGYTVGPSAKGTLRLFFLDPVSAEFYFDTDPTTFTSATDSTKVFRLDPTLDPAQIFPESETPTDATQWSRILGLQATGSNYAYLTSGSPFALRGILPGDLIEYRQAINDLPARGTMTSSWICVTQIGSNLVTLFFPRLPDNNVNLEAGQLLFIDSGPDIGAYTIVAVQSQSWSGPYTATVQLDRPLTYSTLSYPATGYTGTGTVKTPGGTNRIYVSGLTAASPSMSLTVYAASNATLLSNGDESAYLGTFPITDVGTDGNGAYVDVNRTATFPAATADVTVYVVVVPNPTPTPVATSGGGTEISDQYVRFRLYDSVSQQLTIASIPWTASQHPLSPTGQDQITVSGSTFLPAGTLNYSYLSPFRVLRPGVRRVSSTTMQQNRLGAFYFVDLPVIGYGPGSDMNLPENTEFVLSGSYSIDGYTLQVEDENLSFSSQEQVSIVLPNAVLPPGSTPDLDNKLNLAGQNIQVSYDNAPIVDELQQFFSSPLDRVLVANTLVRHFLPAYVSLDIAYTGGSDTDTVGTQIISYINNLDPDLNEIRADDLVNLLKQAGATKITLPITLIALIHGTDRRIRGMRSQTSLGLSSIPAFKGTFTQAYFISGPNTSLEAPRPDGEQIYLTKS